MYEKVLCAPLFSNKVEWNCVFCGQVYADGFAPRELDLMIVDEHPTLLNVTLFPSKVNPGMGAGGPPSRRPWRPPWLAAPRHRPAAEEEVGGAGERGDHPYTYLPVSDTALQWRDQDSRPSNTTPLLCPHLLLSVALLAWLLTKSWLQGGGLLLVSPF